MRTFAFITVVLSFYLFSCGNKPAQPPASNKAAQEEEYNYGFEDDAGFHPDSAIYKLTFQRINEAPDSLIVTDSLITSASGKTKMKFEVINLIWLVRGDDTLTGARVLVPGVDHDTPPDVKQAILRAIAKHHQYYQVHVFNSMDAYYDEIEDNAPLSAAEKNKKEESIYKGFIGHLYHGNYYEFKKREWTQ